MTEVDDEKQVDGSVSRREWLFILAASPLMILLGFHIALLATWIRQRLGIPYILSVSVLMAAEMLPLIFLRGSHPILIPLAAIVFVQLLLFAVHALFCHTKEHYLDGRNAEYLIHAHLMLCLMYFFLPSVYGIRELKLSDATRAAHSTEGARVAMIDRQATLVVRSTPETHRPTDSAPATLRGAA